VCDAFKPYMELASGPTEGFTTEDATMSPVSMFVLWQSTYSYLGAGNDVPKHV
jgi:hypothetical protein